MLDSIIAFVGAHGTATIEQISKHSGGTDGTTRKRLQELRNAGLVYIARWIWVDNYTHQVAAFATGCQPDAPQPRGEKRLLSIVKHLSAEEQASEEAQQRHAKHMRTWTPHRDVAAAWF
ncbi:hypothetical protein [Cupriavidus metallidurans]|uniref:hypothetical protein n=1 Tax=Cupriavidus metallidurans TaxID=119219 RepID=UPI00138EF205|nr:hypothetical protein [Cupriavidus metallidurans]